MDQMWHGGILPPDASESERFLDAAVARLRWAILAAALLIALTWPLDGHAGPPARAFIVLFAGYNLLVEMVRLRWPRRYLRRWRPVFDLLVVGVFYYLNAEPAGPLFALFYLAVVSAAVAMPLRGTLFYIAAVVATVAVVAPLAPLWSTEPQALRQFASLLIVLCLVGIGTAAFTRQLADAAERVVSSEAKLRAVTAQLPAHIWTTDPELRVTSVLGTGLTRLGQDIGAYVGKALAELGEPDGQVIRAHCRALAGEPTDYQVASQGHQFEARVEPLRDARGRVVGCLGLAHDVTERRRGERHLAVQYAVSQTLVEAADLSAAAPAILRAIGEGLGWDYGALWTLDADEGELRCDVTWERTPGAFPKFAALSRGSSFTPGVALPGRVWARGAPVWIADNTREHDLPRLAVAAEEGLRSGFGFPIPFNRQAGGVFEFLCREVREQDHEVLDMLGAVSRQLGQFVERRRAEEELRARARQAAAVADLGRRALATPDLSAVSDEAVALVARTLAVEYAGVQELLPGGEALQLCAGVGWRDGAVGQAIVAAGHESLGGYTLLARAPVLVADLRTEDRFGVPPLLREHGVVGAMSVVIPGRERPFGVLGAYATRRRRFTADDGHFLGAIANVLAAAVERERGEEERARAAAAAQAGRDAATRLQELDRLRREFVASVSHDLRTPLTSARAGLGLLEGLAAERLAADERELLGVARRNIERLTRQVDDLLTANQLEAGTLQVRRAPLDLRAPVTDAAGAVLPLIRERGQALSVDLPEPLPVAGDARRLEQVLVNLLGNAHEHTPDGTRVVVTGRADAADVLLSIADNGPGIPADDLDRIFDRYYRLEGSRGAGSGLGLANVKALVEAHGGRVWAESAAGRGTTFHIALPRRRDEGEGTR
ncbi:MAG: hypothetical protein AVDCRST_MAG88-573 [uncultured Thermomicrobiales bacterium]|uniref:histidine kinase n=1 Tax=uncultured Thermomicrobiales bacterium TaxID=1645740 RepID=A0A6J4UEQ1_9BACT|nr:MAG: hypothetical protein AVDCRST_MAG88-573 [uncultured Thermomicrobiales bacterium]